MIRHVPPGVRTNSRGPIWTEEEIFMNCIFCGNEIKEGAEIINPKTIKDGDVLIRKMIVNEKKKVYAHAL